MSAAVKLCKHCQIEHPLTKEHWSRLEGSPRCKVMLSIRTKAYREKNREAACASSKAWREKNKERHKAATARWIEANKERHLQKTREYHANNREHCLARMKVYRNKNRDELNAKRKAAIHRSPEKRLAQNLRVRLAVAVRRGTKGGSAVRDLGCSIPELKQYLEARFQEGMTWDNYGKVWHIDHIRPLSNYDLTDREILVQLVHYTNLQPMFALDNIRKSNKE